ncbi:hypothetical protein [Pseudofrankia sp. BMG5.37]|uniref:hypothetical protein n=1 Tax=Pseudofrankia sp. BMG5.37 TaxID=3050035 RepID=UPI0028951473|nr:hypothetical protein [Pseudofrankia sp. BMG5.37]MDT3446942.1 hypothetical protein [Pseudofrankia sp. BMG5.37]
MTGRLDDALAHRAADLAHAAATLADPYHHEDQLAIGETVLTTALAVERLATTLIDQILDPHPTGQNDEGNNR